MMKKLMNPLLWMALAFLLPGSYPKEQKTEVNPGDNIIFSTQRPASPNKLPYIEWTFNGNTIVTYSGGTEYREDGYVDRIELDYYTGNLKLKDVRSTDSGNYNFQFEMSKKVLKQESVRQPRLESEENIFAVKVIKCATVACLVFSVIFLLCAPMSETYGSAR
ncbi:uncharacterized protein [Syngnathus scovelli]|uniref:uncharacterized protein n=1 Tax=Syngnathus scovelli TaxID=161590 RepID=UPI0021107435|nr:uncharacterized protein zgc:171497 [Syngnathus scovelli]